MAWRSTSPRSRGSRRVRELRPLGKDRVHHRGRFGHRAGDRPPPAAQGAAVAVVDIRLEAAEETVASIADGGGTGVAFDADVRDRSEIESARDGAVNAFGHVNYLVNNAGLVRMSPLDELSEDEWDLVDTNLKGMYLVTQAIAPVIAGAGGGAIVNLATIESEVVVASTGHPQVHYNASKGGVKMLTKALAVELADRNIRVNAVEPGAIATSFIPGGNLRSPEAGLDEGPAPGPARRRAGGRGRGDLVPALGRRRTSPGPCCRSTGWLTR